MRCKWLAAWLVDNCKDNCFSGSLAYPGVSVEIQESIILCTRDETCEFFGVQ